MQKPAKRKAAILVCQPTITATAANISKIITNGKKEPETPMASIQPEVFD